MKNVCWLFLLCLFFSCSSTQANDSDLAESFDVTQLFSFSYDKPSNPDPEQLSIIRYVLQHTYENNIHKMRGEEDNQVFVHEDGREAVFDKDGNLVTNSYNSGSFNYYSNETEPIKKFAGDIAPWIKWGNTRDDPTSFHERLYYYTWDLDYGIQSYIFEGSKESLEPVAFDVLSKDEKEVYYIFLHLLFNETYKIKLNRENVRQLENDGEYYYEYFYQIQEVLNVKQ